MAHPGNQISLPNLCSPITQTGYELVSAVADPFAIDYRPLRRGGNVTIPGLQTDFGFGTGVVAKDFPPEDGTLGPGSTAVFPSHGGGTVVTPIQVGNINNGNPLLSIPPIQSIEWWHLTIWAQEIIRDRLVDPDFSGQTAVRAARQVSMLKARVTWTEFPSQAREIIVDIGTGLDIFVGPTNQMFAVEIMVPDPTSAPAVRPGPFTTSAAPAPSTEPPRFMLDSWVVASAWCVYGSVGRPEGRFTQSAFLGQTVGIPIVQQGFVDIPIPDNARRVQVFSTEEVGNVAVQWGFRNPIPAGPTVIPIVLTPLGAFPFADGFSTRIVEVPQNAKFMRLRSSILAAARTMTAVFKGQQ